MIYCPKLQRKPLENTENDWMALFISWLVYKALSYSLCHAVGFRKSLCTSSQSPMGVKWLQPLLSSYIR